jgi:hypothetical protein
VALIIKLFWHGSSSEYLFDRPGALFVGADASCDLPIDDHGLDAKVLAVKHSGSRIFVKVMTRKTPVYLDGRILPFNEALTLEGGQTLSVGNESIQLTIETTQAQTFAVDLNAEKLKSLEREEQILIDQIQSQNTSFSVQGEQLLKLQGRLEQLRSEVQALESSKLRRERELFDLENQYQRKHQELLNEKNSIQKLIIQSDTVLKEESRARELLQSTLREKSVVEHETRSLKEQMAHLEAARLDQQQNLAEARTTLGTEELALKRMQDEQQRILEEGESHRISVSELRLQVQRIEEKLTEKRLTLSRIEVQSHEESRKIEGLSFQLERSSSHLRSLQEEERSLEHKVTIFREEAVELERRALEKKRLLSLEAEEAELKHRQEVQVLKELIEGEKDSLSKMIGDQTQLKTQVEELQTLQRSLSKQRTLLETQVQELAFQKTTLDDQVLGLRREKSQINFEKDRAQRELENLSEKIHDQEALAREILESSKLEVETFKREEKMKLELERTLTKAELETLKQRTLMDADAEVRRRQDELHAQKMDVYKEVDRIRSEANVRLRDATIFANERLLEAQELARLKEEAEAMRSKIHAEAEEEALRLRAELHKTLQDEEREAFNRLQRLSEEQTQKLQAFEAQEMQRFVLQKEAYETKLKEELAEEKERLARELETITAAQETEAQEKQKKLQEQLNQLRYKHESKWKDELRREKEEFERTKAGRVQNATQAVMNILVTQNLMNEQSEEMLRKKVFDGLSATIDGSDADALAKMGQVLNFDPEKKKQLLPVLNKYSLQFGLPAVLALTVLLDIGSVRTKLAAYSSASIEEQKAATKEQDLKKQDEWKEKNTFSPPTTIGYKETLLDNVLYTTDYQRVMDDEGFQNEWILKVHDFITKDLELSEDIAINYISAESSVIKDLMSFKKDIHPNHAEKGIERMKEVEELGMKWMDDKFTKQRLARFKEFRKETFDKFHQEKFGAERGVAGK